MNAMQKVDLFIQFFSAALAGTAATPSLTTPDDAAEWAEKLAVKSVKRAERVIDAVLSTASRKKSRRSA